MSTYLERQLEREFDRCMTDEDRIAIEQQPNESPWQRTACPTCQGPCETRVVGLRSVALTCDETMARTERRAVGIDPNDESALLAALATLRSRGA